MKVQSTGLGKSVMLAHINDLSMTSFENEPVMKMTMESTEPLHWYIQVYMEPKDVRQAILKGLKPKVVWKTLLAILFNRFGIFSKRIPANEEPNRPEVSEPTKKPVDSAPVEEEEASSANPLARLKG
ncbi:MAG: hypothetical protein P8Y38_00530 [Deltaproteobacteria bacterium]|jgi:hypothetical protein